MSTPLSGTQHILRSGDYTAVIASVGASLRCLRLGERDLVVPFDMDEVRPAFRGATLAPWPNRIVDATYDFDGATHLLAISEPARGHALHGLAAWLDFDAVDKAPDSVTLRATIQAQIGYPFRIRIDVTYALDAEGLHESVTATNLGTAPAPYGTGPHPYLVAGAGLVDDWTLELPAAEVLTVTPDRLSPVAVESVDDHSEFDFRVARAIADAKIDHAFTRVDFTGEGGHATVRLTASDGDGVQMTWDEACPWVQVHTADRPDPALNRVGLAVEPMTCPPDAFNSGVDLIVLQPDASHTASWTIAAITA